MGSAEPTLLFGGSFRFPEVRSLGSVIRIEDPDIV